MLATFLNKKVSVMRLTSVSGNRKAFQTTQTPWGEIQNIDRIEKPTPQGMGQREYRAWFDVDEDIRAGDLLRRQDTNQTFKVLAVEKQGTGLGLAAEHLEVVIVRYNI